VKSGRAEESILIERPIEDVFRELTDPEIAPTWLVNVVFMSLDTPGPLRVGARLAAEVRKLLGREIQSTVEVVEYDPPHRYVTRVVAGPVPHEITNTLTEIEGGTRIVRVVEGEPGAFFGLPPERVQEAVRRQVWHGLATLKDVMEGESD
jgi:uncharacterized protein YndB with AHSA1/START domain